MDPIKSVIDTGYYIIEGVYSKAECDTLRVLADDTAEYIPSQDGARYFPSLISRNPDIAPFFAREEVVDTIRDILNDEPRLAHTGGWIIDKTKADSQWVWQWHTHYGWEPNNLRTVPQRLVGSIYIDGTNSDLGQIVVIPRGLNDNMAALDWEISQVSEVHLDMSPGSVILFDSAVWHKGTPGISPPDLRYLVSGSYQGRNYVRPHPEDDTLYNNIEIGKRKKKFPILRRLLG